MDFIKDEEGKKIYRFFDNKIKKMYYGQVVESKFLTPNHVDLISSLANKYSLLMYVYKPNSFAERQVVFLSESPIDLNNMALKKTSIIQVKLKDVSISHRDVLGALMSLGINRDYIGDIIFSKGCVYINILNEIREHILFNLESIKKEKVKAILLEDIYMDNEVINTEKINLIVSSLRLDTITSSLINVSRAKAKDIISKERVKVNYVVRNNPALELFTKDVISIKKVGRFIFDDILGNTKKDKYRISFSKLL